MDRAVGLGAAGFNLAETVSQPDRAIEEGHSSGSC